MTRWRWTCEADVGLSPGLRMFQSRGKGHGLAFGKGVSGLVAASGLPFLRGVAMRLLGLVVLALWPCLVVAGPGGEFPCRVSRVTDGDTLRLTCGGQERRVRLIGFDTPEVFHPKCAAERAAGQRASAALQALVGLGPITRVRFHGRDRYGRDLAQVEIAGRDVAQTMLAAGVARSYDGRGKPDWCAILPG